MVHTKRLRLQSLPLVHGKTSVAPRPGLGSILCSCCDESCHARLYCCCDRGRGRPWWLFVKAVQTVRCSILGYLQPFSPSNFPYIYFLLYFTTSLQKIPPPINHHLQPFPPNSFPLYTVPHSLNIYLSFLNFKKIILYLYYHNTYYYYVTEFK